MLKDELLKAAQSFIVSCYSELQKSEEAVTRRVEEIMSEIDQFGTYFHTFEELEHGAKMAWRNSNRCIGRLFWESLHVFDCRQLSNEDEIAAALFKHIKFASNNGKIRPAISIFRPAHPLRPDNHSEHIRIWNHQLLRYAGYEQEEGNIIGDPHSVPFTKQCMQLGWSGKETGYDLLPLVIQVNGKQPRMFVIPSDIVLETNITDEEYPSITELGMKWYGVPIVSDMKLEIGGIAYMSAPFNGWYMGTEIGARNLADSSRYNMLPKVAKAMGLDMKHASLLWKDQALVQLNKAVLQSFKQAGITIVDHHTAAAQFMQFEKKEGKEGRDITGRWSWLVPPLSPATTHLFHSYYNDVELSPNYFYQTCPYEKNE